MMMRASGSAAEALRRQVEILGGGWISLSDLWRAAGRPEGRNPETWLILAAPLIAGLTVYLDGLAMSEGQSGAGDDRLLCPWEGKDAEPWRRGDLMARGLIARAYAEYLDGGAPPSRSPRPEPDWALRN
jgi:hypothetical protein